MATHHTRLASTARAHGSGRQDRRGNKSEIPNVFLKFEIPISTNARDVSWHARFLESLSRSPRRNQEGRACGIQQISTERRSSISATRTIARRLAFLVRARLVTTVPSPNASTTTFGCRFGSVVTRILIVIFRHNAAGHVAERRFERARPIFKRCSATRAHWERSTVG